MIMNCRRSFEKHVEDKGTEMCITSLSRAEDDSACRFHWVLPQRTY